MIDYYKLKIDYLRNASNLKSYYQNARAKQYPKIVNCH